MRNSDPSAGGNPYAELLRRLQAPIDPCSSAIAADDTMFAGQRDHYFAVSRSAAHCVLSAMLAASAAEPRAVLDMPCGHGRVLRTLKSLFPAASFTACDLDRAGVDYCAAQFGAAPVYSDVDLSKVSFATPFDLIWCGSLVTHLDARSWLETFRLFSRSLRPGGLAVVTFHGRWVAYALRHIQHYGLSPQQVDAVLQSYEREGFGYADYPTSPGYGVSLNSAAWLLRGLEPWLDLRVVSLCERQWDDHQDVVAVQKLA